MSISQRHGTSFGQTRAALAARLRGRQGEIEQTVLTRVYAISDPAESQEPQYIEGLRFAISTAVDFGLAVVERGEERAPPTPPILLTQARLAARSGVGLDTVLRRYAAGYFLLSDFMIEEAERVGLRAADLQRLRAQAVLDHLLAEVCEEYAREESWLLNTSEQRRLERIKRLLAGELLDTSGFAYDFEGSHLGAISAGPGAWKALQHLAAALDLSLLAVCGGESTVWAWLGGHRAVNSEKLRSYVYAKWPIQTALAIGEPGEGLSGWRITHHQARAALAIALRGPEPFIRYADVALLASILQDDLFASSLRQLYLAPLSEERDGGEVARQTLRAYFSTGGSVSSTAAVLQVTRQTVRNRLRAIEERLHRSLNSCAAEVEVALRLDEVGYFTVQLKSTVFSD